MIKLFKILYNAFWLFHCRRESEWWGKHDFPVLQHDYYEESEKHYNKILELIKQ